MAARKTKLSTDDELAAALVERIRDLETIHNGAVRIVLHRSHLKGRIALRAELCDASDGRLLAVRVRIKGEYPNGDTQALTGTLYKLIHELDAELTTLSPIDRFLEP